MVNTTGNENRPSEKLMKSIFRSGVLLTKSRFHQAFCKVIYPTVFYSEQIREEYLPLTKGIASGFIQRQCLWMRADGW